MHELAVKCHGATNCVLVGSHADLDDPQATKTKYAHWNGTSWCDGGLKILARGRGILGNTYSRATTTNQWWMYYLDPNLFFCPLNPATIKMVQRNHEIKRSLLNRCLDNLIRDDRSIFPVVPGFWSNLATGPDPFRYNGASAFIQRTAASEEAWALISYRQTGQSGFKLRHTMDATNWSAEIPIIDNERDDVAGILTIDPVTNWFYLFYLRVNALQNTYDVCYRIAVSGSESWSSAPNCPVSGMAGKSVQPPFPDAPNDEGNFGNNLFSGAVYNGNIVILYAVPMVFRTGQYRFRTQTCRALDGQLATVTSSFGGTASATIR